MPWVIEPVPVNYERISLNPFNHIVLECKVFPRVNVPTEIDSIGLAVGWVRTHLVDDFNAQMSEITTKSSQWI